MVAERPIWRHPTVLALGLVSFLTDVASEMVMPLLPAFLAGSLGAGALALGLVEGLADGTAAVLKLASGRIADRFGRARPLVLAGYSISSLARPLVALATHPAHVILVRVLDRVGKGVRTSPRDALLAGAAGEAERGRAFGFHRAMDHAGAVVGPLVAFGFLTWVSQDLRQLFAFSALPGALAVAAILFGVKEAPMPPRGSGGTPSLPGLTRLLVPLGIASMGRMSDTFLLLLAGESRSLAELPLIWVGLHVVKVAVSATAGALVDRIGARPVAVAGWFWLVAVYAALALELAPVIPLVLLAGVHRGLVEASEGALVAERAGEARGEAFGRYHLVSGVAAVVASVGLGAVWELQGAPLALGLGAGLSLLGALALLFG